MLIYVVTDRRLRPDLDDAALMREAARSGADMIQIREKDLSAARLLACARAACAAAGPGGPVVLVNGRVDVALAAGAGGVHLPAAGLPAADVRRVWGGRLRIGLSTHGLEEARQAGPGGADFITFGPVFETLSKRRYGPPQGVERLAEAVEAARPAGLPVLAIGGINRATIGALRGIAIAGVAVISAVIAARDMQAAVAELRGAIA